MVGFKRAGSDPVGEPQEWKTVTAVRWNPRYSHNVPAACASGEFSSFTASSRLFRAGLLVWPRAWAIRRENSLLFFFPANTRVGGGRVRKLNVLMHLGWAAAFTEVNAKLISTMQRAVVHGWGCSRLHTQRVGMREIKYKHAPKKVRKPQTTSSNIVGKLC